MRPEFPCQEEVMHVLDCTLDADHPLKNLQDLKVRQCSLFETSPYEPYEYLTSFSRTAMPDGIELGRNPNVGSALPLCVSSDVRAQWLLVSCTYKGPQPAPVTQGNHQENHTPNPSKRKKRREIGRLSGSEAPFLRVLHH